MSNWSLDSILSAQEEDSGTVVAGVGHKGRLQSAAAVVRLSQLSESTHTQTHTHRRIHRDPSSTHQGLTGTWYTHSNFLEKKTTYNQGHDPKKTCWHHRMYNITLMLQYLFNSPILMHWLQGHSQQHRCIPCNSAAKILAVGPCEAICLGRSRSNADLYPDFFQLAFCRILKVTTRCFLSSQSVAITESITPKIDPFSSQTFFQSNVGNFSQDGINCEVSM
jgi:hypothetical protein